VIKKIKQEIKGIKSKTINSRTRYIIMADDIKTDKNEIEKDKKDTEKDAQKDKGDITDDKKDTESEKERKERERKERKKASQKKYREKIKALNIRKKKESGKTLEIKTDMKPKDKQELPSVAEEKKRSLPMKVIFGIVGLVVSAILIIYFMSHKKESNDGFTIKRD
jgi:cobalamin biosynthesis Mg chelatase CobN